MTPQSRRKSFTIKWRVENCKFFLQDTNLVTWSPWFFIDALENTDWRLCFFLTPRKTEESFILYIERHKNSGPPEEIDLDYHFSVFSDHSSTSLFDASSYYEFQRGSQSPVCYIPKSKIYKLKEGECLLPETLTIQCKIWKKQESMSEDGECLIVTKTEIERMSFVGMVGNFCYLMSGRKRAIQIRSASYESSLLSMSMGLSVEGTLFIEFMPLNFDQIRRWMCVVYLLDIKGNETKCGEGESLFVCFKPQTTWKIPLELSKKKVIDLHKQYLTNDYISLQCEIAFEQESSKIVKTKYATNLSKNIEKVTSGMQNFPVVNAKGNPSMVTVKDDLLSFLLTGMMYDTKLQTATETFFAHKLILSVRSPVFSSLFNNNLNESINDCVEIEDLDAETVRSFLVFLYSDRLQDLDLESAMKLYSAGDKYEVLSLKDKCLHFLKENLCTSNCCDILILADRHGDSDVKKIAQECIVQHDQEVLQSDQWKHMEETNPTLTIETFHIIYNKYRRIF